MAGGGGGITPGHFLAARERFDGSTLIDQTFLMITEDAMPAGNTSARFFVSYPTMPAEIELRAIFLDPDSPLGILTETGLGTLALPESSRTITALMALAAIGSICSRVREPRETVCPPRRFEASPSA
jgi:hypothetical protein